MADNTTTVTESVHVYRPLSGLALMSLGLGVLAPLSLLTLHPGVFMALPLPGFILAVMARRRIARAEGNLAGESLATIGLALNLVSGLAWLAMYATTAWFIKHESQQFAEQWIVKIHAQNESEVFLDTRPPKLRKINFPKSDISKLRVRFPAPGGSSEFDKFRSEPMTSVLMRYGHQLQWYPIGVVDWKYDKESFTVRHRYQVVTEDQRFNAAVDLVTTSETVTTNHGPRREWRIAVQGGADVNTKTVYMEQLTEAEREATKAINHWTQTIAANQRDEAAKVLADPNDRLRQAELDYAFAALRKELPPNATAELRVDQTPALVKEFHDDASPDAWKLTFRTEVSRGLDMARNSEPVVEFLLTIQTDNLRKGPSGWKITECKHLGEHIKPGRVIMSRGGGAPGGAGTQGAQGPSGGP